MLSRGTDGGEGVARLLQSWPGTLAAWALVAVGAVWLVMHWSDIFFAASPESVAPRPVALDMTASIAAAGNAGLFGRSASAGDGQPIATAGDIKLRGVFAGGGDGQGAIVNTGGNDTFVPLNGQIAPGVILRSVDATHIVVARNGAVERVDLDILKSGDATANARRPAGRQREAAQLSRDAPPVDVPQQQAAPVAPNPEVPDTPPGLPGAPQGVPVPQGVPQGAPIPQAGPQGVPLPGMSPVPGGAVPAPQSREDGGESFAASSRVEQA